MHVRKFYCFDEDESIVTQIRSYYPSTKIETVTAKYAYIIHKALVAKIYNKKEYDRDGFRIRMKPNADMAKKDPKIKFGTLSYLFGGQDKSNKTIVDNLINWGIIEKKRNYQVGVSAKSYKLTSEWEV